MFGKETGLILDSFGIGTMYILKTIRMKVRAFTQYMHLINCV